MEKTFQKQVDIVYCDGYRDAWSHSLDPLTLTPDEMDSSIVQRSAIIMSNTIWINWVKQWLFFFLDDLVEEYEAAHIKLANTAVAGSNNEVGVSVEANVKAHVSAQPIITSLRQSSEKMTVKSASVSKEDVDPSLGN